MRWSSPFSLCSLYRKLRKTSKAINLTGKFTKNKDVSGFDYMHKMQVTYIFSIHDVYRKEEFI
jgi:hypothetical protein